MNMRRVFICGAVCSLLLGGTGYGAEKAAAAKSLTGMQCEQVKKDLKSQISALTRQFKACMQSGGCKQIDLNKGLGALAGQLKSCNKSGNCQEIKGKIAVLAKKLKTTDRNCAASLLKGSGSSSRQGDGFTPAKPEPPKASTAAVTASTGTVAASSETIKTSTTPSTSTGAPSSGSSSAGPSSSGSSVSKLPPPVESEPVSGFQQVVNGVKDFFAGLFSKDKKKEPEQPKVDKGNCWKPTGCESIAADYKQVKGDLFVKDQYDDGKVDPLDIKQGTIGDCYYLASVAAIAQQNPDAISKMVRKNADGTYSVDFYRERKPWEFWKPKLTKETVTIDQLAEWKKNKYAITAGTPGTVPNLDVTTDHAYYVMDVNKEYGIVTVGNPWGNEVMSMPLEEFKKISTSSPSIPLIKGDSFYENT